MIFVGVSLISSRFNIIFKEINIILCYRIKEKYNQKMIRKSILKIPLHFSPDRQGVIAGVAENNKLYGSWFDIVVFWVY